MTSTPCQSAALDRIIAPWAAKIALFFRAIIETILTIAAIVRTTLHGPGACCRKAGQRLLARRRSTVTDNRRVDLEVSCPRGCVKPAEPRCRYVAESEPERTACPGQW